MLKIIQWNINGYINNYIELQILIRSHNPHIISLQETHLYSVNNIPIPPNYKIYNFNSTASSHGGVALLIHSAVQHTQITINTDFEAIAATITSKQKISIVSAYISPNIRFHTNNLDNVFSPLSHPSMITGDFNAWHCDWGSPRNNNRGSILSNFINSSNFILLNDGSPTHLSTHNSHTHIDLTFCSPTLSLQSTWQVENDLHSSDHYPIIITLFQTFYSPLLKAKPLFLTKYADWVKYSHYCYEFNKQIPVSSDVNKEAAVMKKIILRSANLSIPQTKPNTRHKVPWWNQELQQLKDIKRHCWRILKRSITAENVVNYKRANATFKRKLKMAKRNALSDFTAEITPSTPSNKIWTNIKLINGLYKPRTIHCLSTSDQSLPNLVNPDDIAEEFCKYWSDKSSDFNFPVSFQCNKNRYLSSTPTYLPSKEAKHIENPITFLELTYALNGLKGKTPGMDRITYPMIKNLPESCQVRLLKLYNQIFDSYIPQSYKTSIIIPILKSNKNKTILSSYRPISLNPCYAKLLDKIIAQRLWWFISQGKLINSHQIGFKKGKSVSDCLVYLDYLISDSLARKNHVSIISLDFESAFDKIGIHVVSDQLAKWKLGPKIINYVKNFMLNRKIIIKNSNVYSSVRPLSNGIPQGSPLSVVIFLIAFNKVSEIISAHKSIKFIAYADDFNLIKKLGKCKNVSIDLRNLFSDISEWCQYSGAQLSFDKCKHLHVCRKYDCTCNIITGNLPVTSATQIKVLGVIFNQKYNWNDHICYLRNSLISNLNVIKCLSCVKYNCNISSLISIIHALILSKINYAIYLYGFSPKTQLSKIKVILNSALRLSFGALRSTPISNLLFEANIKSIEMQRDMSLLKLSKIILNSRDTPLFKIITGKYKVKYKKFIPIIFRAMDACLQINLPVTPIKKITPSGPPWLLNKSCVNTSLHKFSKQSTPPVVFCNLFRDLATKFAEYSFTYTDGSKTNLTTSYSVTTIDTIISTAQLPDYTSVFTSEILAIFVAISILKNRRGKHLICTDSLSALNAIQNLNNNGYYVTAIRNQLISYHPKIMLLWVPGHVSIPGNEFADRTAKSAISSPLISSQNYNYSDMNKHIKKHYACIQQDAFTYTSAWYQQVNILKSFPNKFITTKIRQDITKFERLRLGHTKLTHQHYMSQSPRPYCPYCNSNIIISIKHILNDCVHFSHLRKLIFKNIQPTYLLGTVDIENVIKISSFLKRTKLYHLI